MKIFRIPLLCIVLCVTACGNNVPVQVRVFSVKARAFSVPETVWVPACEAQLLAIGDTVSLGFMHCDPETPNPGLCIIQNIAH